MALNARRRGLCSEELEQQFRTRGEDPREFRRLHRDLIAVFHPKDRVAVEAVAHREETRCEVMPEDPFTTETQRHREVR